MFDETDKKLLVLLQKGIPVCSRPYHRLAEELGGVTEAEVICRISALKEKKLIRRFSGFFESRRMGYVSALCAAIVPEHNIDAATALLNGIPGVTHNYLRDHVYNMWFTLICKGEEEMIKTLRKIEESGLTDGKVLRLDGSRQFKIRTMFDVRDECM